MATEERKRVAETKQAERLKKELEKFTFCPNGLTVPEFKSFSHRDNKCRRFAC
jgi:hypothetical protein